MEEREIKPEMYLSLDVEANGPVPGLFSMLSFAFAAFTLEDGLTSTFERNLKLLPGAGEDTRTMEEFWAKNQEAYFKTRINTIAPAQAIHDLDQWAMAFTSTHKIVNLAGPAGYDWSWITYYMAYAKPGKKSNLGYACMDMRSYAAGVMKRPYRSVGKGFYPKSWFEPNLPHTHIALDDAIEQGAIMFNMMRENLGLEKKPFIRSSSSVA